ncbi:MAG: hypothetical protein SWQ30_07995 [Thermodesulfobacteriota bacterium]|nr:hypothetical protein [Thermodesulfobacteriota bacterium]
MFDSLRLSDLPKVRCGVLRYPSHTRPALWVVEEDGVRAVVKDFSQGKRLYRSIVGRFLVWRESRAYNRLRGLDGVPALYRVIDGQALVVQEIPGKGLKKHERETGISEAFFDRLRGIVSSVHRRGVAHCDLKHAGNVVLGCDGRPYIVDWAASISEKEFRWFPLNLIFKRFLLDDEMAIIKLKLQQVPESLTPEERSRYERRSEAEKTVRAVRDSLRKRFQKMV